MSPGMSLQIARPGLVNVALLALIAGLSIVIAAEVAVLGDGRYVDALSEVPLEESAAALPDGADAPAAATVPMAPLSAYAEITRRPLFDDSRRPTAVEVDSPVSTRPISRLSAQWRLTGIVRSGENSFVLLENKRDRKTVRLQQNGVLDGWRLDSIDANRIGFVSDSGAESVEFELYEEEQGNR